MASKALLLVLASFLLINTQGTTLATTGTPNYKTTPPPPITKAAAPPPPPAITKATPPPPPVKASPPPPAPPPAPRNREECIPVCTVRCQNHSRPKVCMRACLACCERCKCVPPGQSGNYEKCGKCYSSMTTHGGKLKCP